MTDANPVPPKPTEDIDPIQRQREILAMKATVAVITDGIDFISKQTISVGESRRIANFLDYLQDMKKDFKARLKTLEEPTPSTPEPAAV